MKDKILLFIIGVLVGAVISTGAFFVYQKASCSNNTQITQESRGDRKGMPGGPSSENGQPPEKPGEDNTQNKDNSQNKS